MKNKGLRFFEYTGLLLVLILLFIHLEKVDLSLMYYWQQSVPVSLAESLQDVGGWARMVGDHLLEMYTLPFWGNLLAVLLIGVMFFLFLFLFRKVNKHWFFFSFVVLSILPFALLFHYYRLPIFMIVALLTGALLGVVRIVYCSRFLLVEMLLHVCAGSVVYYVSGTPGLILFFQFLLVNYLLDRKYRKILALVVVPLIPLVLLPWDTTLTVKSAYLEFFSITKHEVLPFVFYLSLILPLILFCAVKLAGIFLPSMEKRTEGYMGGMAIIFVVIAAAILGQLSVRKKERDALKVLQAGLNHNWERILQLTGTQMNMDRLIQFEVNRALYHESLLLERLFFYPQQYAEKGIFMEDNAYGRVAVHVSDFYYDLGYVAEARHWANEASMVLPRHPLLLKHLSKTYLAMGNKEASQKYLNILGSSFLNRKWAIELEESISKEAYQSDPEIQKFLAMNPSVDFMAETGNPDKKLANFYNSNLSNKMAFEFLVASNLLKHQIGNMVLLIPGFRQLGYEKLPRVVEEALMVYLARTKLPLNAMAGYTISRETAVEFEDFSKGMTEATSKLDGMNRVLKYRHTYWFYILFNSPYAPKN